MRRNRTKNSIEREEQQGQSKKLLKVTRIITRSLGRTLAKRHKLLRKIRLLHSQCTIFLFKGAPTVPDEVPLVPIKRSLKSSWNLLWRVPTRVPLGQYLTGSTAEICAAISRLSSVFSSVLFGGCRVNGISLGLGLRDVRM